MSHNNTKPKTRTVLNPLTGKLENIVDNNFSYESVPENKKLTIYENQQMTVHDGGFAVDGELDLYGSLILED